MPALAFSAAALALTAALCVPVRLALLRLAVIDNPNARSSHVVPTVRGGGIAVAAGVAITTVVGGAAFSTVLGPMTVIALAFALVGLTDDFMTLGAKQRLGVQICLGAAAGWWVCGTVDQPLLRTAATAAAVIWITGYVNAFNFMDGINGISAAQAIVAGISTAVVGTTIGSNSLALGGALIAGASLGFAPFNFPSAKMFLGDVGSYFIGAWIALAVLVSLRGGAPVSAAFAPVTLYLADTSTTLARRVRRGDSWYEAHREHTYQRLVDLGWSHARTTLFTLAVGGMTTALGIASIRATTADRALLASVAAAVVVAYLTLPSMMKSSRERV